MYLHCLQIYVKYQQADIFCLILAHGRYISVYIFQKCEHAKTCKLFILYRNYWRKG